MTGQSREAKIECMARAMMRYDSISMNKTWRGLAETCLEALEEYYGSAQYWMVADFEREKVLREIEKKVDEIRDANISTGVHVR